MSKGVKFIFDKERINPLTTKKAKIEVRILAAMDSCFDLVRPRQHGIANTLQGLRTTKFTNLIG